MRGQAVLVARDGRHCIDHAFAQGGAAAEAGNVIDRGMHAGNRGVVQRAGLDPIGRHRLLRAEPVGRQLGGAGASVTVSG